MFEDRHVPLCPRFIKEIKLMKRQIFAVIFALFISVVTNASQTFAQSQGFRVDVPFDFSVNDKTLPAGTYVLNSANDNRLMWKIESAHQGPSRFLIARNLSSATDVAGIGLTFRRYGDRHFLIGFTTSAYQVELPTSGSEKDVKRTDINAARLVNIETHKSN
jgi:hypothetical protein